MVSVFDICPSEAPSRELYGLPTALGSSPTFAWAKLPSMTNTEETSASIKY